MPKVVGVKFQYSLKAGEFLAGSSKPKLHDFVVVETGQGLEIGQIVYTDRDYKGEEELTEITRLATKKDLEKRDALEEKAKGPFETFINRIEKYNLKMNPIGVSFSLDESKVVFYFTADGRIDFRELAKDLSRTLKKQAIMRQIGPRDEAKLIGGYGRCGQPVCCGSFMTSLESITMEDAEKAYGMPKNANKISGLCGRLMCCIKFEEGSKAKKRSKKPVLNDKKGVGR